MTDLSTTTEQQSVATNSTAAAPAPAITVDPIPEAPPKLSAEDEKAAAAKEATEHAEAEQRAMKFYSSHQSFIVGGAATIVMTRGEDLIMHSPALRTLVNTYVEAQRRNLMRINADGKKKAGRTYVDRTDFSEPLIVMSVQGAAGTWSTMRQLHIAVPEDLALLDARTKEMADNMARDGMYGFVLILEALEQTSLRVVGRSTYVVKVRWLNVASVEEARNTTDMTKAVELLNKATDFQLVLASCAVEDIYRRMAIVRAAEKAGRTTAELSFEPGKDHIETVEAKYSKYASDLSLNVCLKEMTANACSYQAFEIQQQQQRLLMHALVTYPEILATVKREIEAKTGKPTIVAIGTRSAQIIDEIGGIAHCTTKKIENDLAEKEANNLPADRPKKLLSVINGKKLQDCGADAIVLEIIDRGRGMAYGNQLHHVNYFGDILAMEPRVLADRAYRHKIEADKRTKYEKDLGPPKKNDYAPDDKQTSLGVAVLDKIKQKTVAEINKEYEEMRARLEAEYKAALEAAPDADALVGANSEPPPPPPPASADDDAGAAELAQAQAMLSAIDKQFATFGVPAAEREAAITHFTDLIINATKKNEVPPPPPPPASTDTAAPVTEKTQ